MATSINVGSGLKTLGKATLFFKMAVSPEAIANVMRSKFFGTTPDSPRGIMKDLGDRVVQEILQKYDSTRSHKNRRRSGKLRSLIDSEGPFMDNYGNIRVIVANKVLSKAPYWSFVEFGVEGKTRQQWFRIVGTGKRGDQKNKFKRRNRKRKGKVNFTSAIEQKALFPLLTGGLKLIPIKKGQEGRIKGKVFLEFEHRGFKGGHFFAHGISWVHNNGTNYVDSRIDRMFKNIERETNAKLGTAGR